MIRETKNSFLIANQTDLYKQAIPADNSYCEALLTNEPTMLAYKIVKIEGPPFTLMARSESPPYKLVNVKFVLVSHEGKMYRVNNLFYKIEDETATSYPYPVKESKRFEGLRKMINRIFNKNK